MKFSTAEIGTFFEGLARIIQKRQLGKIAFWNVRYREEVVQLVLKKTEHENYDELMRVKVGNTVYFAGYKFITASQVPSIMIGNARNAIIFNGDFPEKFHGLNQSHRYANRALDLVSNPDAFDYFKNVSDIYFVIRNALAKNGFREFNTGLLQEKFEGGLASSFSTHCNANGRTYHLSLTSEIKLKKLIVAGFERVYEINQSFRNEGIDDLHSPEFTLLEAYGVHMNFKNWMHLIETFVSDIAVRIFGCHEISLQDGKGKTIEMNFMAPFERITFLSAWENITGCSREECCLEELIKLYPNMFYKDMPRFTWVMKIVEKIISPKIVNPIFLTEIPSGLSPFVKMNEQNPEITDRAFFIARGIFIADIYTDNNDFKSVKEALELQSQLTGNPINDEYLEVLMYGIPQTAGIGLGINRLLMLFLNKLPFNIKETILYPIR